MWSDIKLLLGEYSSKVVEYGVERLAEWKLKYVEVFLIITTVFWIMKEFDFVIF